MFQPIEVPMRDFYNTVPRAGGDECLRKRGKRVEDPSAEVIMMFVTHCPDPTLALLFQLKSPEDWTVAEVQSCLDSYVGKTVVHSQHTLYVASPNEYPANLACEPQFSGAAASSAVTDVLCHPVPSPPS